ncbi:MAG: hypothetical protein Q8P59_06880, partial [Dehalococcoidia bacterium]|nr:hypothetical protein [Dehalococcoidia bacterium]
MPRAKLNVQRNKNQNQQLQNIFGVLAKGRIGAAPKIHGQGVIIVRLDRALYGIYRPECGWEVHSGHDWAR